MDIFISWSGPRSEAVAKALHGWLPKIVYAFKPWLSSADVEMGARWSTDVATRLQAAKAGIICVTPSNLHSDWMLFEAGALSKTLENTFVCPLLIGLNPTDVKGPLAQFQATKTTREGILRLLRTLNTGLGDGALPENLIEESFGVWWPKLEAELHNLPAEDSAASPPRSDRDVLEEILELLRSQNRLPSGVSLLGNFPNLKRDIGDKVLSILGAADPDIKRLVPILDSTTAFRWRAATKDKNGMPIHLYQVIVPYSTASADLPDVITAQIPADRIRHASPSVKDA